MRAKADEIRRFLEWLRPDGPHQLVAIPTHSKGSLEGETFEDVGEAAEWAAERNEALQANLYYTLNSLRRKVRSKPTRKDIGSMDFLHVDVDPRVGEDLESEQKRIESFLKLFEPRPSALIFSGGGYQALWRLEEPVPIEGKESAYEDAKLYNKQLEVLFEADACHNIDRLMRLPGTVNWPDARKRKKGRVPTEARIVWAEESRYDLRNFAKAPKVQQKTSTGSTDRTVEISGNIQRLDSTEDLGLPDLCRRVIANGNDPEDLDRFDDDRSAAVFYVCCEMVRQNLPDDAIFAIITDPDWAISAHVLDQPRPEEYAVRQIARAREHAIDEDLVDLNDQFAVVHVGGSVRIMFESWDPFTHSPTVTFLAAADFNLKLQNRFKSFVVDGKEKTVPLAKWWLAHAKRREYEGVVFYPGEDASGYFNLWRGFAYEAKPGDCSTFLDHVRKNICGDDDERFDYLVGWMARAVQMPHEPGQTAIVLRGKQGTGKGFLANHFGRLFGRHFLPVRDSSHLFGQFNGHLQDCVVLFADESFWVDSTKQKSMLKSLITESEFVVERKHQDAQRARNCVHLIMASNEAWVVPIEGADRRFCVFDVAEDRIQDNEYFAKIAQAMEEGGYEALLHYLMTYDLGEFDVRAIPQTTARDEQKKLTFRGFKEWWFTKLSEGRLLDGDDPWPKIVPKTALQYDFLKHSDRWDRSHRGTATALGIHLSSALPGGLQEVALSGRHAVRQIDGEISTVSDPRAYVIPPLIDCRKHWNAEQGTNFDWPDIPMKTHDEEESRRPF